MTTQFNLLINRAELLAYLKEAGHTKPTAVQSQAIGPIYAGTSVSVLAQTGQGKTLAFLLPTALRIKERELKDGQVSLKGRPRAIIMAPTRELARQIFEVLKGVAHHLKLRVRMLDAGGKGKSRLAQELVDIVVGVPGKMAQSVSKKELDLSDTSIMVLDEADQMLENCFKSELELIIKSCPKSPEGLSLLQVALFSATMPLEYLELRTKLFKNITFTDIMTEGAHLVQALETFNIYLSVKEKIPMAIEFMQKVAKGKGIIFVNKKETVSGLLKAMQEAYPQKKWVGLHGGMSPIERKKAFTVFKKEGEILISSDIAARGIDLPAIVWILNFDLPFEAVYYIHRAGRAGRQLNQMNGKVYNFVTSSDKEMIVRINEAIGGQSALKLGAIQDRFEHARKANSKSSQQKAKSKALLAAPKRRVVKRTPGSLIRKKKSQKTKSK